MWPTLGATRGREESFTFTNSQARDYICQGGDSGGGDDDADEWATMQQKTKKNPSHSQEIGNEIHRATITHKQSLKSLAKWAKKFL